MKLKLFILSMLICNCQIANATSENIKKNSAPAIFRKPLLTAMIHSNDIEKIEIKEINFAPLQPTGLHKHPVPVVGYVAEGTILFQIEGQPSRILHKGDAFYEPANVKMIHFDNFSSRENAKFITFYLMKKGNDELIHIL